MSEAEGIISKGEMTMFPFKQGTLFCERGQWFANLRDGRQVGNTFASPDEAAQALMAAYYAD